jgi:hypothetical protein
MTARSSTHAQDDGAKALPDGWAAFRTLTGAGLTGLVPGEACYWFATYRSPGGSPAPPWWITALLVTFALLAALRAPQPLRSALVLFGIGELARFTPIAGAGWAYWSVRSALTVGVALLMVAAGWRETRPSLKMAAVLLLLAAIPVRYWTLSHWHRSLHD